MSPIHLRSLARSVPAPAPDAFVIVSIDALPAQTAEEQARRAALYEWAFNTAREVVRPSILELDLLGCWN